MCSSHRRYIFIIYQYDMELKLKNFIKILSVSALHLFSLEINAENISRPLDVVLDEMNNYKGEIQYSIISASGDMWRSGNANCDSSICNIIDLQYDSFVKPGSILTLSEDGIVKYATPYGPEYVNKMKIFSDPISLGKYVTLELEKEGYKKEDLLETLRTDNVYTLYLTLSKIYTLSEFNILESISYIESGGWESLLSTTPTINNVDSLFLKNILNVGLNVTKLEEFINPVAAELIEIKYYFDSINKEGNITSHQIFQKLDETQTKINLMSETLTSDFDNIGKMSSFSSLVKKNAIEIENQFRLLDAINNKFIDTVATKRDIFSYLDRSVFDEHNDNENIRSILTQENLVNLNSTKDSFLETSLFEEYASNLLLSFSNAKNLGLIEDYTTAYEIYNSLLLEQYFKNITTLSKLFFLEFSDFLIEREDESDRSVGRSIIEKKEPLNLHNKTGHFEKIYKNELKKTLQLLEDYLVEPDYKFKNRSSYLYYGVDLTQAELVRKKHKERYNFDSIGVVLANNYVTAYYSYNKNLPQHGVLFFIPKKIRGAVFKQNFMTISDRHFYFSKEFVSNCYDNRFREFELGSEVSDLLDSLDLKPFSLVNVTPLEPLPMNGPSGRWTSLLTEEFYSNTCVETEVRHLTRDEIDSINKRLNFIIKSRI
ncbi:hypothetical protein XV72_02000 [Vibrio cholerae]|nr:hypothetical protein XV72_02000 [Vibrio cholerae]PAR98370.1 hypothetical protein CGT79_15435 [Vibrio cholerae]PAS23178.1 hypothetical protein CGT73_06215 [Vibrio cholerae]